MISIISGRLNVVAAIVVGVLLSVATARADGVNPYGNLVNSSTYGWCGATSITNSLQYLQNTNPGIYNGSNSLITGGSLAQTRAGILSYESGVTVTGTTGSLSASGNPASNLTVWNSKIQYINAVAPGLTTFAAQMDPALFSVSPSADGYLDASDIQSVLPTHSFLQDQLAAGEDVEIAINNLGNTASDDLDAAHEVGGGHMVTLVSLNSETGAMTYLDPNNPANFISTTLSLGNNGFLTFDWNNGVNAEATNADIYEAWAESPVPLPAAWKTGIGLLAISAIGYRLRRRRPTIVG